MTGSSGRTGSGLILRAYMAIFFAYLMLPLVLMVAAGFNAYSPPSVTVWRGFTLRWFSEFRADEGMWPGLVNSLVIAVSVMALAGAALADAARAVGIGHPVMVSTPGIIIVTVLCATAWAALCQRERLREATA